jgi:plastocyanin
VGAAGETQAQLEQQAVTARIEAGGKQQTADVVLNSATFQYEPKVIKVKKGTPVRFNLSVINGDPG